MSQEKEERHDAYIIPPNFIETGSVLGGMFKLRNAIEAIAAVLIPGFPILNLSLSLTVKIIMLCLTALPLGLLALIGVNGESLSSFIINFFKFLMNRRVVRQDYTQAEPEPAPDKQKRIRLRQPKEPKPPKEPKQNPKDEMALLKQRLREVKKQQRAKPIPAAQEADTLQKPGKARKSITPPKSNKTLTVSEYLPIEKIENGVIYTRDHRYVKIMPQEVFPGFVSQLKNTPKAISNFDESP